MKLRHWLATTRLRRLLLAIVAPAILGSLISIIPELIDTLLGPQRFILKTINQGLILVPMAFIFMGIQSLIAALLMEFVVLRLATTRPQIVFSGAVLGTLCGATIAMLTPIFTLVGLLVGLILGWVFSAALRPDPTPGLA